jgi:hypothetical protein
MKVVIFDPSFDEEISFLMLIVVLEDQNYLGISLQVLLRLIDFDVFSSLPRGGMSSQHLTRLLHPRQY